MSRRTSYSRASHEGEFDTSTTTDAPLSASASPSARECVDAGIGRCGNCFVPCLAQLGNEL